MSEEDTDTHCKVSVYELYRQEECLLEEVKPQVNLHQPIHKNRSHSDINLLTLHVIFHFVLSLLKERIHKWGGA